MRTIARSRYRVFPLVMVSLAAGLPASLCAAAPPAHEIAPDFTLDRCLNADTLRLSDFLEHPVLLFFFDASLISHIRAFPYVREWNRRYHGDGLAVLGIHCPAFEPLKVWENALAVLSRASAAFPIGMDMELDVYDVYSLEALPTFILLRPQGEVVFTASGGGSYRDTEAAIQQLLSDLCPGIIHPFLLEPERPADAPGAKTTRPTPIILLGHGSGAIADCDSADFGKYALYADHGGRQKERVHLQGKWKVDEHSISHQQEGMQAEDHIRIIYAGKDVWLLPDFESGKAPMIYIKQDRSYLPIEIWGEDVRSDEMGRPYLRMRYAIPTHVVSNRNYGTHELWLIPSSGDATLLYLFFEGASVE